MSCTKIKHHVQKYSQVNEMVGGSEDDLVINKGCSPNKSVKINENSNNVTNLMERGGGGGGAQTNESSAKRKSTAANEGPAKKQKR